MDVKKAFLHGKLSDELDLAAPKRFDVPEGKVVWLKKSLYGLKQAPRTTHYPSFSLAMVLRKIRLTKVYSNSRMKTRLLLLVYMWTIC